MKSVALRYPVDRYLVESSKNIEMVNIIDDDLWNPEPALRPEDEIILKKLHEMLQSTADDLKLLSGELSKFHEPGVQVKTAPTPLDEEFNEKVHIEEVVNAKFHGYKIKDKPSLHEELEPRKDVITTNNPSNNIYKSKITNTDAYVNTSSILKKQLNRNLGISHTKVIQINANNQDNTKINKLNNGKVINNAPAVAYNEFSYKYVENKNTITQRKALQVQEMPSINIRSELKEQKVLCLDILPENNDNNEENIHKRNISVVAIKHESDSKEVPSTRNDPVHHTQLSFNNPVIRKVSKMSVCESSGSSHIISSDAQIKVKTQNRIKTAIHTSHKSSTHLDRNKNITSNKKEPVKRQHLSLDQWKKKLNIVYGPSKYKKHKVSPSHTGKTKKVSPTKSETLVKPNILNNAEYIPYSQLTLGGVKVNDVEREISNMPTKNGLPLSPIGDKVLRSRDASFTKSRQKSCPKILTTSDENLLHEVIDIERTVSGTLTKNKIEKKVDKQVTKPMEASNNSNDLSEESRSYVDDFEEEKSENTECQKRSSFSDDDFSKKSSSDNITKNSDSNHNDDPKPSSSKIQNKTFTKSTNLSFKESVDIFEFVHSVATHDIAIQSNASYRISPKETQTSPRTDMPNIQPIHNDLWPSMDPKGEVEKLFQLEKDFIKKLIIEEYGDLLEKNLTKPSTSKQCKEDCEKNMTASQKNTQTSPAHVKSVMTSPTRTKTRTTSPLALPLPVDHQTSPLIFPTTQEENVRLDIQSEDNISFNLSSPRFSLRLPQNSQEVLSNLGTCSNQRKNNANSNILRKYTISSSSSIDADNSSSELSSLGEIKLKLKKRLNKMRVPTKSESSSTSAVSLYSSDLRSASILPLRSEGEVSLRQNNKKKHKTKYKSEGETSQGLSK